MTRTIRIGETLPERRVNISALHIVLGAIASRDWQPQHHDHEQATAARLPGIILNAPSQIGWFIGYVTAWTGPHARIARWRLSMLKPICPGTRLVMTGTVRSVKDDPAGLRWIELDLAMSREDANAAQERLSAARMLVAMPGTVEPWAVTAEAWRPPPFTDYES